MAIIHKKVWPGFIEDLESGKKKFDLRLNDFEANEGDTVIFEEWDPEANAYTGRSVEKKITYVLKIDLKKTFWSKKDIEEKGLQVLSIK